MRLFIAVHVPEDVQGNIERLVQKIRVQSRSLQKAKWVRPHQMHLTLKFLGEVGEEKVGPLKDELDAISKGLSPFSLSVQGIGAFPKLSHINVLWAGVADQQQKLKPLARSIEEACVAAGFPPAEKPFSAHLTLARFSQPLRNPEDTKILERHDSDHLGEMEVDRFCLVQSRLRPEGPDYIDLREFLLKS